MWQVPSQGTKYRVVYKKVAVRRQPDTKSEALRQLTQGECLGDRAIFLAVDL